MTKLPIALILVASVFTPFNAQAQSFIPPTAKQVLDRACLGKNGQTISTARLAEALVIETNRLPSDMTNGKEKITDVVWSISNLEIAVQNDLQRQFAGSIQSLESALFNAKGKDAARIQGAPIGKFNWLFNPGLVWVIQCPGEAGPTTTYAASFDPQNSYPKLVLRGSIDDLTDIGDDRLKSSALKANVTRERSTLENGSKKTDTNLSISGTLGWRLTNADDPSNIIYAYASYALERARSRPSAPLAPGVNVNDGDTNSIDLGFTGKFELTSDESPFKLFATTKVSYLHDFIHDSNVARLGVGIRPVLSRNIGICQLGSFKPLIKGVDGIFTRCSFLGEFEGAQILKKGTSEFGLSDQYVAVGGSAQYEVFSPTFGDDGIFAKAKYRYLPIVSGRLANIDRLDLEIGYRIWSNKQIGFDVGINYSKGTNDKSFEKDDRLALEFGVIF